ncbi:hypothetical protein BT93_L2970 [Corymbia citriodora subsp. variegata]|uniref:Uncharacterized protein n=1 Tax=Corymbia citriodora subsp. variegata TaxID=360336 RepID=A0A8T0CJM0_CORYI|nr:hypothetical protein BT93_L2970 [Corymbia citriodora subsp. variegata]
MSFSSSPNHFRHHFRHDYHSDDGRDYRVRSPHHARQHHHIDEPRDYRVQRSDTEVISYDSYPHYAHRPHTDHGLYGHTDRTEPRKARAVEIDVYDNSLASYLKDDAGSKLVADEDINDEAEQFIRMEHRKFNMSRWMSKNSG